jgi:hypothetical protein
MGDRQICAWCGTEVVNGACPNDGCPRPRRLSNAGLAYLRRQAEQGVWTRADDVLGLLDEIHHLQTEHVRVRAVAHLALGREVTEDDDGLVECWSCTADRYASDGPCCYCGAPAVKPQSVDKAIELPVANDGVVDLMAALEASVAAARAARTRKDASHD